jgi:hypothetical protein
LSGWFDAPSLSRVAGSFRLAHHDKIGAASVETKIPERQAERNQDENFQEAFFQCSVFRRAFS